MTCPICWGEDEHLTYMGAPCPVTGKAEEDRFFTIMKDAIQSKYNELCEVEELKRMYDLNALRLIHWEKMP